MAFSNTVHPCYRTPTWKRLRKMKLARNPFCQICERRNKFVRATTVDHLVSLSGGGEWFPPLDKLFALCAKCHAIKTNRVDRIKQHTTRNAFAGTDTSGAPLDPHDPWNTS